MDVVDRDIYILSFDPIHAQRVGVVFFDDYIDIPHASARVGMTRI